MEIPLVEGAAVAVLIAGTAILVRWQPSLVAELYSRLIFRVVSFGMPREARDAWRNEALNYLLEKIWADMKTRAPEFVILNAVARANDLGWNALPERAHYRNISGAGKPRLSLALGALREQPYIRLFSWRRWAGFTLGPLLLYGAALGLNELLWDGQEFATNSVIVGALTCALWLSESINQLLRLRFGWDWRAQLAGMLPWIALPIFIWTDSHLYIAGLLPIPYALWAAILVATGVVLATVTEGMLAIMRDRGRNPFLN